MRDQDLEAGMAGEQQSEREPPYEGEGAPAADLIRGEAAAEGGQIEPLDVEEALRRELEACQEKQAEYLDGWQRARAELANARKRFQRDQEQVYTNARADVLTRLLPVIDDFERAFDILPPAATEEGWLVGIRLIRQKFQNLLDQEGVSAIEVEGAAFDPVFHEAVSYEPSTAVPEGHIIDAVQTGYCLGERVLRPSMVRVSAGPLVPAKPGNAG
ncbi:MAG: nucleotide exchange factor GrpE [Anaerolineae bacterium]|nr:nucleotide exchange factor GrpE [Anaerolineae bacterium]